MTNRLLLVVLNIVTLTAVEHLLENRATISGWGDPKILSACALWLLFALVVFLRYRAHAPGRQLAVLTILAFAILVLNLVTAHSFLGGGGP